MTTAATRLKPGFSFILKKRFIPHLLFCLICLQLCSASAQPFQPQEDWRFDNFNSRNHFITISVENLCIDPHGYLWASTDGVSKFDGFRTIRYNSYRNASAGFKYTYAPSIVTDKYGRVWFGTNGGICYYDDIHDRFNYLTKDARHPITYAYAFALQNNYLWFACNYGLAKLDLNNLQIQFTSLTNIADPLISYIVNDSILLISSRAIFYQYDILKNSFLKLTISIHGAPAKVTSIIRQKNAYFMGTDKGVLYFETLHAEPMVIKGTENKFINDLLFHPFDSQKKFLLIGTDGEGLLVYNTTTRSMETVFVHNAANPYSLNSNVVNKFAIGDKGILWIGTAAGISMLDYKNQSWKAIYLNSADTSNFDIYKLAVDGYDSTKLWMSCSNFSLLRLDWTTKKIDKIWSNNDMRYRINDLIQVSKNKWLLLFINGIAEWDAETGRIESRMRPLPRGRNGPPISLIHFLFLHAGEYYIGSSQGLFKYNVVSHTLVPVTMSSAGNDTIDDSPINSGFSGDGRTIWMASQNMLIHYDPENRITATYPWNEKEEVITDMAKADINQIVCTCKSGIVLFDISSGHFRLINQLGKVNNPYCMRLIVHNAIAWISSNAGLLNYNLSTNKSEMAISESSLLEISYSLSPFCVLNDQIILGFRNGLAYFNNSLGEEALPSNPIIQSMFVNNRLLPGYWLNNDSAKPLVLKYNENFINFSFTAFQFRDPDHIKFRYRMDGIDKDWQSTGEQRSVQYAQLPPGKYSFHVQAGNSSNEWASQEASIAFEIKPPFWGTWWFTLGIIAMITGMAGLLYKYKDSHLKALEAIRKKIAADFHDDLGSTLTSISIYSEVAIQQLNANAPRSKQLLREIGERTRGMIRSMNEMIWSVKPENDSLLRLLQYMQEFGLPLAEAQNVNLDLFLHNDLAHVKVDMIKRKNLFFIFKESFTNAIKYSKATRIEVTLSKTGKTYCMLIRDNGDGFDPEKVKMGNGISNIRKRAKEIKGYCEVLANKDGGTSVRVYFKTA